MVIFLTGSSASGKSALAETLAATLAGETIPAGKYRSS